MIRKISAKPNYEKKFLDLINNQDRFLKAIKDAINQKGLMTRYEFIPVFFDSQKDLLTIAPLPNRTIFSFPVEVGLFYDEIGEELDSNASWKHKILLDKANQAVTEYYKRILDGKIIASEVQEGKFLIDSLDNEELANYIMHQEEVRSDELEVIDNRNLRESISHKSRMIAYMNKAFPKYLLGQTLTDALNWLLETGKTGIGFDPALLQAITNTYSVPGDNFAESTTSLFIEENIELLKELNTKGIFDISWGQSDVREFITTHSDHNWIVRLDQHSINSFEDDFPAAQKIEARLSPEFVFQMMEADGNFEHGTFSPGSLLSPTITVSGTEETLKLLKLVPEFLRASTKYGGANPTLKQDGHAVFVAEALIKKFQLSGRIKSSYS